MKIIQGNTNKISGPVVSWSEIMPDAMEMIKLIDEGGFDGLYKECFALAHSQVSMNPKSFFVVDKNIAKSFGNLRIIANAKIVKKSCPRSFQEGCMSFPHRGMKRVRRYDKITVIFDINISDNKETGVVTQEMELEGLEAYIVQHEVDHAKGIDIYQK